MLASRRTSRSASSTNSVPASIESRILLQQVHQVGESVERVVDLVRDGGHQPPGGGQFLRPAHRFFQLIVQLLDLLFGQLAFRHVANGAGGERAFLGSQAG